MMNIKLSQFEIQTAISEYLQKRGVTITDEQYTETFVKHTKTHTRSKKGNPKKLKVPQSYEFFWYSSGYEFNNEEIEFSIFIDDIHHE